MIQPVDVPIPAVIRIGVAEPLPTGLHVVAQNRWMLVQCVDLTAHAQWLASDLNDPHDVALKPGCHRV